jgi:hypothetical protein
VATLYRNFLSGTTTDAPLLVGATSVNGSAFAGLPEITAPDFMWLVLDPEGDNGAPEIVKITAHTELATEVTVERAQQNSSAREHPVSTTWHASPITRTDAEEWLKTVVEANISAGAVTESKIGTGAVTLDKIGADAVDGDKIADDSVGSEHIVDGAVEGVHIADGEVTLAKIAAEAWTSYVPTLTQGVEVTVTVTYSKYEQRGKTVTWNFWLAITTAGTSGQAFELTLPVEAAVSQITGSAGYYDAASSEASPPGSALRKSLTAVGISTTEIAFEQSGTNASLLGGSFAAANGDVLHGSITYEAA